MIKSVEFFIVGREMLKEPYHLEAVGLDYVHLLNGVTIESDPDYGSLVTIEDLDGLHQTIALHLIEKVSPLGGPELRFLRKVLGLTEDEFALMSGVGHWREALSKRYGNANDDSWRARTKA